jgi:glycosyltransferase involved in cell wall biosynthesis
VSEDRRTKVALVLEATQGGTLRHLLDLLEGLSAERFDLLPVVSPRSDGEILPQLRRMWTAGRRAEVVSMRRNPSILHDAIALFQLWRLFRRERPDVVHSHGSKGGLLGRLAARLAGVPRIYHTPHVYPFQWARRGFTRLAYLLGERLLWRLSTRVIAVGQGQAEVALQMRVASPQRLTVIPNGVDAARFAELASAENRRAVRRELGLDEDDLAVGMVARLAPQKGCGHFLRAARIVAERNPRARFLLIGAGPLLPYLHALSEDLGLRARVMFLGHRRDAARLYAGLDLFVLSSLWEGLPYVVLEAQASGLPVVASRIPGCVELIEDGVTGFLVDIRDESGIAGRICELLDSAERRAQMGEQGRRNVTERFRLDTFLGMHADLYEGRS